MSLIAAISSEKVIASQIIEGGVDAIVYENFIYQLLNSLRKDKSQCERPILLFMDNAPIHKHSSVLITCQRMKANVIFNA